MMVESTASSRLEPGQSRDREPGAKLLERRELMMKGHHELEQSLLQQVACRSGFCRGSWG